MSAESVTNTSAAPLAVDGASIDAGGACRTRFGTFPECPLCSGDLTPEHAHFKCRSCGWRDSCCD